MTYAEGNLVTVNFSGEVQGITTTDDLTQEISDALQNNGFKIRSITITTPTISNVLTGAWLHYMYTGVIVFQAAWDTDESEFTDAVSSAVLGITGLQPTAFEVSAGSSPDLAHPVGATGDQVTGAFSSLFTSLGSGLQQIGWGFLILIGLLVALLVFRPDIARAA